MRLAARTDDDAARLVMGVARIETSVGSVRMTHPDVAISIDTWRAEVPARCCPRAPTS